MNGVTDCRLVSWRTCSKGQADQAGGMGCFHCLGPQRARCTRHSTKQVLHARGPAFILVCTTVILRRAAGEIERALRYWVVFCFVFSVSHVGCISLNVRGQTEEIR